MTKKLSIIASGLLISSTMAFGADSIDGAFKEGKVSGTVEAFYGSTNTDDAATADSGFSTVGTSLAFETGSYMGLSAKVGFVAASVMSEENDGDADTDMADNSILSEASLTFTTEGLSITAGRQAIDLEWLGDYNEAVVASITAIPNTTLTLGYTDKQAVAGIDEISSEFGDINGTKGVYVADAKIALVDGLEANPYYYSAPDVANFYGLKTTYSTDMFGALVHYAASNEDVAATEDGSMLALEVSTEVSGLSLALGYIKTDKDGGLGSMDSFGDNYEPMDDGSAIYEADAKMIYGSIGYSIAGFDLGAAYAQTKIGSDKDKELNLMVDYGITDTLGLSVLYADISAETAATEDQDYINAYLTYSF